MSLLHIFDELPPVLRQTIMSCPSILVEMGFMTNPNEANYFLKPKNVKEFDLAIIIEVINYLNSWPCKMDLRQWV